MERNHRDYFSKTAEPQTTHYGCFCQLVIRYTATEERHSAEKGRVFS